MSVAVTPALEKILTASTVVKVESADGELFILDLDDAAPSGWLMQKHNAGA